jgi:hypothetical protein
MTGTTPPTSAEKSQRPRIFAEGFIERGQKSEKKAEKRPFRT